MEAPAQVPMAGPRGRRLCLELVMSIDPGLGRLVLPLAHDLDPARGTSRILLTAMHPETKDGWSDVEPPTSIHGLVGRLMSIDVGELDEEPVISAFVRSVGSAQYWQEPDGEDALASLPMVHSREEQQ